MRSPALFLLGFLRSSVFQRFAFPNAYLRRSATRSAQFSARFIPSATNDSSVINVMIPGKSRSKCTRLPKCIFQCAPDRAKNRMPGPLPRPAIASVLQSPALQAADSPQWPISATRSMRKLVKNAANHANRLLFTVPQSHFSLMLHGDCLNAVVLSQRQSAATMPARAKNAISHLIAFLESSCINFFYFVSPSACD